MTSLRALHEESVELLAQCRDLLEDRPAETLVETLVASLHEVCGDWTPRAHSDALARRGWIAPLTALSDDALDRLEAGGLEAAWPASAAPAALIALLERARVLCALPLLDDGEVASVAARRHETPRKQAQVDAFARLLAPLLAGVRRVVDVGSGHGHLTRAIAARLAPAPDVAVIGLERDASLTARARALAEAQGAHAATFVRSDVVEEGLALGERACVIGLHACGALGDTLVTEAARVGASALLVGCCLQKRRAPERASLTEGGPAWPRALLGLSNLALRDDGVEASRADNLAARARRLALSRLLAQAGAPAAFGAEMAGLNRRAAHDALPRFVARAFALRRLPPPDARAIDEAGAWAVAAHGHVRRLQLPRTLLARVLEVHVLLDRARFLEERGFQVTVGLAFPTTVSARNLALVARAPAARGA